MRTGPLPLQPPVAAYHVELAVSMLFVIAPATLTIDFSRSLCLAFYCRALACELLDAYMGRGRAAPARVSSADPSIVLVIHLPPRPLLVC